MDTRRELQDFIDGRDEVFDVFECKVGFGTFIGIETGGYIFYVNPFDDNQTLVFIATNFLKEAVDAICDMSEPRVEVLAEHCPTLIEALIHGTQSRYDKGAFIYADGNWLFGRVVDFNFSERVDANGINALSDSVILNAIKTLQSRFGKLVNEFSDFNGFSTWEEIKITAKEALPGIRWGLTFGRIFGNV